MRRSLLAVLPMVIGLGFGHAAFAQDTGPGLAGPYLAARSAVLEGNHRVAAVYFENALAADPGNPVLIGNAIFANAALGQWMRAETIAEMLPFENDGGQELVNLVRMVRGMATGWG